MTSIDAPPPPPPPPDPPSPPDDVEEPVIDEFDDPIVDDALGGQDAPPVPPLPPEPLEEPVVDEFDDPIVDDASAGQDSPPVPPPHEDALDPQNDDDAGPNDSPVVSGDDRLTTPDPPNPTSTDATQPAPGDETSAGSDGDDPAGIPTSDANAVVTASDDPASTTTVDNTSETVDEAPPPNAVAPPPNIDQSQTAAAPSQDAQEAPDTPADDGTGTDATGSSSEETIGPKASEATSESPDADSADPTTTDTPATGANQTRSDDPAAATTDQPDDGGNQDPPPSKATTDEGPVSSTPEKTGIQEGDGPATPSADEQSHQPEESSTEHPAENEDTTNEHPSTGDTNPTPMAAPAAADRNDGGDGDGDGPLTPMDRWERSEDRIMAENIVALRADNARLRESGDPEDAKAADELDAAIQRWPVSDAIKADPQGYLDSLREQDAISGSDEVPTGDSPLTPMDRWERSEDQIMAENSVALRADSARLRESGDPYEAQGADDLDAAIQRLPVSDAIKADPQGYLDSLNGPGVVTDDDLGQGLPPSVNELALATERSDSPLLAPEPDARQLADETSAYRIGDVVRGLFTYSDGSPDYEQKLDAAAAALERSGVIEGVSNWNRLDKAERARVLTMGQAALYSVYGHRLAHVELSALSPGNFGVYNHSDDRSLRVISINDQLSGEDALKTLIHEDRHAQQHFAAEKGTNPMAQKWQQNFDHYKNPYDPGVSYKEYKTQPVEKDAFQFEEALAKRCRT